MAFKFLDNKYNVVQCFYLQGNAGCLVATSWLYSSTEMKAIEVEEGYVTDYSQTPLELLTVIITQQKENRASAFWVGLISLLCISVRCYECCCCSVFAWPNWFFTVCYFFANVQINKMHADTESTRWYL